MVENVEAPSQRWYLASVGAGALALWYLAVAGPPTFGVAIGLLWYGTPASWVIVLSAMVFLLMAWLATPTMAVEGRELTRAEAPLLFDTLDRLRADLQAPPIQRVLLSHELNAGAYQHGPVGLPWPVRQTLVLGVPLLAVLRPEEARAVLAHEMGHFSRRHGLFGHWIYRVRRLWMGLARPAERDDSPYERALQWFAGGFGPWFGEQAFQWSRQCEYEADRDAAQACGESAVVAALQTLLVVGARMDKCDNEPGQADRRLQIEAPADRWSSRLRHVVESPLRDAETSAARARVSTREDTHPTLTERAAALGVRFEDLPQALTVQNEAAGPAWLGHQWTRELSAMDAEWHRSNRRVWRDDSIHLCHAQARWGSLASSSADASERVFCLSALERRAELIRTAKEIGDARAALSLGAQFLLLEAELAAGQAGAAEAMQGLLAREPAFGLPARAVLLAHATQAADQASMHKHRTLLERAIRRRENALQRVHGLIEGAKLRETDLPDDARAAFVQQWCDDEVVAGAWLGACDVALDDGRGFAAEVLVLQIDPEAMRRAQEEEGQLAGRYRRQLERWLGGPQKLAVVRTCFTAEANLPGILDRQTSLLAWRR